MTKKLSRGLWRPNGTVVCIDCHVAECGETFGWGSRKTLDRSEFEPVKSGLYEEEAVCEKCGKSIWMHDSIAWEQRVVIALKEKGHDAFMQQTGGMCSAAQITLPEDDGPGYRMLFITAADDENVTEPTYYCGYYRCTKHCNDDEDYCDNVARTFDQAIAWAERILAGADPLEERERRSA